MGLNLDVQRFAIMFVPFFVAVVFHEFAHGFIAMKWGDTTAKDMGRLTLNPLPHVDPLGTIVFPIVMMLSGTHFLFGWAKPVPINPNRFHQYRPGLFWVSFAGPLMNFLLAILSAVVFCLIQLLLPQTSYIYEPLLGMSYVSVSLNFALGIFNLIPLPPLDGSKMIESYLPYEAAQKYESLARYSFFILMALMFTGAIRILAYPIMFLTNATLSVVTVLFGLAA